MKRLSYLYGGIKIVLCWLTQQHLLFNGVFNTVTLLHGENNIQTHSHMCRTQIFCRCRTLAMFFDQKNCFSSTKKQKLFDFLPLRPAMTGANTILKTRAQRLSIFLCMFFYLFFSLFISLSLSFCRSQSHLYVSLPLS